MPDYKLSPSAIKQLQRKVLLQMGPLMLFAMAMPIGIFYLGGRNMNEMSLHRREITQIRETRSVGLTLYTSDRRRRVGIPRLLDGYEELRGQLSTWGTVTESRFPPMPVTYGATLVVLCLFGLLLRSSTPPRVVIASGSILFVFMLASGIYLWRSPYVDRNVKNHLWAVVFVLVMIAVRVYAALR